MSPSALVLRLSLATAAALAAPLALASPCAAPASYVKAPDAARAPLLRPFVLAGLTSTALQQRGNERWLELAVPSVATAQRALAGVAGLTDAPRLAEAGGVVLLACSSLGAPERVAQQGSAPLATPLW
jgi:hypothetical protein